MPDDRSSATPAAPPAVGRESEAHPAGVASRGQPLKAPFPWFGGKSKAAPAVWVALGDCEHYIEPFAGSMAVLLGRPHEPNRPYYSETVNDADGLLCNAWRAIQQHPDAVAAACSWPVSEADIHARHLALIRWRDEHELEHLMGDPHWCDPQMAGWWLYGIAGWIGAGWCAGDQPWTADQDGRLYKQRRGKTREPGISRKRPHLGNNGQGVQHAGLREPGISRKLPHLGDNGQGVQRMTLREPGISRQLPHLGDDGKGVQRMTLREPGLSRGTDAAPAHIAELLAPSLPADAYHPLIMPKLAAWFAALSARLRHVRIVHGDWQRVVTSGAMRTLSVRKGGKGGGACGVFLDPPYTAASGRAADLYTVDSGTVADDVRAWCVEHGAEPDLRIVLAGWSDEHEAELLPLGWRVVQWCSKGWLTGGYGSQSAAGSRNARERLLLSPHCLSAAEATA
jgi:hypothetical protein